MRTLKPFNACNTGGNLPRLDLVGLSALVGSNATKAGIPYTCLIRSQVPYLNAYVTVGTFGLAHAVLSCIDWRPARILIGAGEAGSMLELCGLKASGNATYVGQQLAAGGALPVRGVVGEAVVLELLRQGKERDCSLIGRDAGRPTSVVWAIIHESTGNGDGEVYVVGNEGALINYLATSACVAVLVLEAMCHEWFCFALVATGMFLNAMMAFLLRSQKFEVPSGLPWLFREDSVIVILKDDPDVFCVLRGTERAIRRLLQYPVIWNAKWVERLPLFLVSVAYMIYSAVVVLGVLNMKATPQLLFLIVVCVGAMTDLIKGSWSGLIKRRIAKDAIANYAKVEIVDVKKFGTRTASIACIAASNTKLDTLIAAQVLPTAGTVWQNWWIALRIFLDGTIDQREAQRRLKTLSTRVLVTLPEEDKELWKILLQDMRDGCAHAVLT